MSLPKETAEILETLGFEVQGEPEWEVGGAYSYLAFAGTWSSDRLERFRRWLPPYDKIARDLEAFALKRAGEKWIQDLKRWARDPDPDPESSVVAGDILELAEMAKTQELRAAARKLEALREMVSLEPGVNLETAVASALPVLERHAEEIPRTIGHLDPFTGPPQAVEVWIEKRGTSSFTDDPDFEPLLDELRYRLAMDLHYDFIEGRLAPA